MKIIIAGDFFPGLRLEDYLEKEPSALVPKELLKTLKTTDLSIVNLECPLTESDKKIDKTGPALKGKPIVAKWLKNAGFDLVTLANNHILDYGQEGIENTIATLNDNSINYVGGGINQQEAAKPFFFETNGVKIAILNFAENEWSTTHSEDKGGANPVEPIHNFRSIISAKEKVDHVIVITHGGHEMYRLPSPRMKKLFRFYVDAGASAVINHHTHCTSGFEMYKSAPICYSIGNFLFDHTQHRAGIWNRGMLAVLDIGLENINLSLKHFNQSGEKPQLTLIEGDTLIKRQSEIQDLNLIIDNDIKLETSFKNWIATNKKMYKAYIEPHTNRILQALQNRAFIPSFWRKRKKLYLLNLIRCESHHDILQNILEDEVSHS